MLQEQERLKEWQKKNKHNINQKIHNINQNIIILVSDKRDLRAMSITSDSNSLYFKKRFKKRDDSNSKLECIQYYVIN